MTARHGRRESSFDTRLDCPAHLLYVQDSEHGHNSVYLPYFDLNNFAWRAPRPQEIEQRRANLDDLLIFDILLRSGSVRSPDILYPPHNEQSLLRLLEAIEKSNYDTLKKDCLVYFLLKWHQDGREDRFAMQKSLPPQFTILADAYWHLDSGINVAVSPFQRIWIPGRVPDCNQSSAVFPYLQMRD